MKDKTLYLLLLVMFGALSCNNKIEPYESIDTIIAEANTSAKTINVEDFKAKLENEDQILIIDCREEKEFIEGHIPGAINIPRGMIEFSKLISDRRMKLYVYSQSNQRAALSIVALKKLKYKHVFMIDGAWQKWNEKYPEIIEKGSGNSQNKVSKPAHEDEGGCG